MLLFGDFVSKEAGIDPNEFVFNDAAGENDNRLTLKAEVQLLEYNYRQSPEYFHFFFDSLPILGIDGSLEDFAKNASGAGKIRAKPGTGIIFNHSTGNFFLVTQAFAGYIEAKNGHLIAYEIVVNNATMSNLNDIFEIFEDESQLSNYIYDYINETIQN